MMTQATRMTALAALAVLAACGKSTNDVADTAAPAMAPGAATMDTSMRMDTSAAMRMDTTHRDTSMMQRDSTDTTRRRDTTRKP